MVGPRALAVLRFMTRSNWVGCSTGISPGFVPRKILSTNSLALRRCALGNDARSAPTCACSRAVPQQCPVPARRGAERVLVAAAEMGEIGKAAGERDLRDAVCGAQGIDQIAA